MLGDDVAVVHVGFVLFVLGGFVLIIAGELLRWRWTDNRWLRVPHVSAVAFTLARVWLGITCPLWILEDWVRGDARRVDRVAQWCHRICFRGMPQLRFQIGLTVFAVLVFALIILALKRRPVGGA